jgi:hypothetical protein
MAQGPGAREPAIDAPPAPPSVKSSSGNLLTRIHATRARRRSSPVPAARSSFRARKRASPSSGVRRSPRTTSSRAVSPSCPSVVHRHSMGAPTPAAPHSHSGLRFRNRLPAAVSVPATALSYRATSDSDLSRRRVLRPRDCESDGSSVVLLRAHAGLRRAYALRSLRRAA